MDYETKIVCIEKGTPLYEFCLTVCSSARTLYNAALYLERQVYTSIGKEYKDLNEKQKAVLDSIKDNLDKMNATVKKKDDEPKYQMPSPRRPFLNYGFLNAYMHVTQDPLFYDDRLKQQAAQNVLKDVANACMSFLDATKAFAKDPKKFAGKPALPNYLQKQELRTVTFSNGQCELTTLKELRESRFQHMRNASTGYVHSDEISKAHKNYVVYFNGTELCCDVGKLEGFHRIKEVKIQPYYDAFRILVALSKDPEKHSLPERNKINEQKAAEIAALADLLNEPNVRACSIDLGVDNFAAITNNVGAECILFQVRRIKALNQYFNKKMAELKRKQALEKQAAQASEEVPKKAQDESTDKARSEDSKDAKSQWPKQEKPYKPRKPKKDQTIQEQINHLCMQRDHKLNDWLHKIADAIICWCLKYQIRVIVVGRNNGWKQKANMGAVNNQNFVYIPHAKFIEMLRYRAEREHIYLYEQEESYTSQASFRDDDWIPTFHEGDTTVYKFSGVRGPTVNAAGKKKPAKADGKVNPRFRGLYRSADGTYINADLNASANIGRKALPRMFTDGQPPDFKKVIVIKNPDEAKVELKLCPEPEKKLRKEAKKKKKQL